MDEAQSKGRMMPILDLEGKRFFVDIRMKELRQVDDFMNSISLKEVFSKTKDGQLLMAFDHKTNNVVKTDLTKTLPKGVSLLELPNIHDWIVADTQKYFASYNDFYEYREIPEVVFAKVRQSALSLPKVDVTNMPLIELDGTTFCIDLENKVFRQVDNAKNKIPLVAL